MAVNGLAPSPKVSGMKKQVFVCLILFSVVVILTILATTNSTMHSYTGNISNKISNIPSFVYQSLSKSQAGNKSENVTSVKSHEQVVDELFDEDNSETTLKNMVDDQEQTDNKEQSEKQQQQQSEQQQQQSDEQQQQTAKQQENSDQQQTEQQEKEKQPTDGEKEGEPAAVVDNFFEPDKSYNLNVDNKMNYVEEKESQEQLAQLPDAEQLLDNAQAKKSEDEPQEENALQAQTTQQSTLQACERRDDIMFFKMHKCSSSTIQNLLFRYGEKHDLTFVMPPKGNYLGYPMPFNRRYMIQVPWNSYNIYTFHSRFNYKGISEVMPKDTLWVTAIRDPVKMYESGFTYFRLGGRYGLKGPDALKQFLQNPDVYFQSNANKGRVKNPMLYDLGMDVNDMYNMAKIETRIDTLGNIFNFVIITEYFDESLILLKDMMCWELDDVVYFKLNARSSSSVRTVTQDMAEKIKKFNAGDVKLYNYFNESFFKKWNEFGKERMKEEVAKLQKRKQELQDMCVDTVLETSNRVYRPPGLNVEDFRLKPGMDKNPLCKGMTLPELMYIGRLRDILYKKIRDYTSRHARLL